jgi:hypothetical protein
MWFTCCILHNMLLEHDDYASALNTQEAWEALDPEEEGGMGRLLLTRTDGELPPPSVSVMPQAVLGPSPRLAPEMYNSALIRQATIPGEAGTPLAARARNYPRVTAPSDSTSGDFLGLPVDDVFQEVTEPGHGLLRAELVEHYKTRWKAGTLEWPRAMTEADKAAQALNNAQAHTIVSNTSRAPEAERERLGSCYLHEGDVWRDGADPNSAPVPTRLDASEVRAEVALSARDPLARQASRNVGRPRSARRSALTVPPVFGEAPPPTPVQRGVSFRGIPPGAFFGTWDPSVGYPSEDANGYTLLRERIDGGYLESANVVTASSTVDSQATVPLSPGTLEDIRWGDGE